VTSASIGGFLFEVLLPWKLIHNFFDTTLTFGPREALTVIDDFAPPNPQSKESTEMSQLRVTGSVSAVAVALVVAIAALAVALPQESKAGGITPQAIFTVNSTADHAADACGGECTLRDAITDSNASVGVLDTVRFNLSGGLPHTINVGENTAAGQPLPAITDTVIIDGTSEPDYGGAPVVVLDGGLVTGGERDGLHLAGGSAGSTIQGLAIVDFSGDGIDINANNGHAILDNYIGIGADGTTADGNSEEGMEIGTNSNSVRRNVISANSLEGVDIFGNGNTVQENVIGLDANGVNDRGNLGHGVLMKTGASNNQVTANNVSGNALDGVAVTDSGSDGNSILGNSIFANDGLGIDLNNDGNTAADTDDMDPDTGPNDQQNHPLIDTASSAGTTTTVNGTLNSNPSSLFTLEFFASPTCDASGKGEGRDFLGTIQTATDGNGDANFNGTLNTPTPAGQVVTATATNDTTGDTSQFSTCETISGGGGPPPPPGDEECQGEDATIVGTDGNDNLQGTAGDDVVVLLDGNDTFDGQKGNDLVCAGAGDDEILGAAGGDDIFGEGGEDTLSGQKGNDELSGGSGDDDTMKGGPGNDQIAGGSGVSDNCNGGDGIDSFIGGSAGAAGCEQVRGIP
jgi:CSLREA domain-containing protein